MSDIELPPLQNGIYGRDQMYEYAREVVRAAVEQERAKWQRYTKVLYEVKNEELEIERAKHVPVVSGFTPINELEQIDGRTQAKAEKGLEPVAWMFVTRDRKSKRRDEFAAIDWSPSPDDDRELISKRPLAYAHPSTQVGPVAQDFMFKGDVAKLVARISERYGEKVDSGTYSLKRHPLLLRAIDMLAHPPIQVEPVAWRWKDPAHQSVYMWWDATETPPETRHLQALYAHPPVQTERGVGPGGSGVNIPYPVATFLDWWTSAPHRAKYHPEHPVTLAAREAWDAASCQSVAPVGVVDRIMPNGFRWLERHATLPPDGTKLYSLAEIVGESAAVAPLSSEHETLLENLFLISRWQSGEHIEDLREVADILWAKVAPVASEPVAIRYTLQFSTRVGYEFTSDIHQMTPFFREPVLAKELLYLHSPVQSTEPVAWLHDKDGREDVISSRIKEIWLKAKSQHVEHYTIPLYAHPPTSEWNDAIDRVLKMLEGPPQLGAIRDGIRELKREPR